MSKNIDALLKALNVTNVDEIKTILLGDEEKPEAITDLLKVAQNYSKPFIEAELNEKFKNERGQLKGKYMKETLNLANKTFGSPLSSKEIEEVLNDPENSGKTIDKALELLKEKVKETTGASESDLKKMLDTANQKIQEYERTIPEITTNAEKKAMETINKFKLDGIVSSKLIQILEGKTTMPAAKAAELIRGQLSQRALIKLQDDGNLALFKLGTENEHLKKNETTLHTFDSLVEDVASEFEIMKKSNGTERKPEGGGGNEPDPGNANKRVAVSKGLAAKMGEFNLPS